MQQKQDKLHILRLIVLLLSFFSYPVTILQDIIFFYQTYPFLREDKSHFNKKQQKAFFKKGMCYCGNSQANSFEARAFHTIRIGLLKRRYIKIIVLIIV